MRPYLLWRLTGVTSETIAQPERLREGLALHLHYANLLMVLIQIGARQQVYLALHGCSSCTQTRCAPGCPIQLLLATGWQAAPAAIVQIDQALAGALAATTVDMVRGHEGAAAAAYFGAWRVTLTKEWGFNGRAFHPPPDPVNALLSFGYTLVLHEALGAIQLTGLDPYLGTFHVIEVGRPSLALDLLEEFRPLVVDQLVLNLLQTKQITRQQFERPQQQPEAVYLDARGRSLLIDRYERVMLSAVRLPSGEQTTLRRVLLLQAQALARVVRGEQERYVGYTP